MKTLCLFFCIFLSLTILSAEELQPPWKIIQIPLSADETVVNNEITNFITAGYRPVGLDILGDDTLSILGQRAESELPRYILYFFESTENIETEFALFFREGWSPADAVFFDGGMLTLFLETDANLIAWNMFPIIADNLVEFNRKINELVSSSLEKGLEPFALTRLQGYIMIGFITIHRSDGVIGNYLLETYPNDGEAFVKGINEQLLRGYDIRGYDFHDGNVHVAFFQ